MKNRIINIAIEQMKADNMNQMFRQQAFFKEYFKMFRNNKVFDKEFIKYINENIDINNVINISNTLINLFENKLNILSGKGIKNVHYNNSVNQLFKLKLEDFGNYINEYFETAIM